MNPSMMNSRTPSIRAAALLAAAALAGWASGAAAAPPSSIGVSTTRLTLQGQATRSKCLIDLYSIALYLPHPFPDAGRIWNQTVPKALRVEILYNGSLPDKIPRGWKQELLPPVTFQQEQTLMEAYAKLNVADTIWIAYTPDLGTRILIVDRVVLADPGDELMRAFLDLWMDQPGPRPDHSPAVHS
jgi:Chalcone isomerase-like